MSNTAKIAIYAALVLFALAALVPLSDAQCQKCPDNEQTCCGNSTCCPDPDGGYMCCPQGGLCCNGTCCSPNESCCNGTCCIEQTTFCCPKLNLHPARCCPRWTVCCPGGQDGCCTPMEAAMYAKGMQDVLTPDLEAKSNGSVIYALFNEVQTIKAVKIDVATGTILANVKVDGFNNWGEMTRIFSYDEKRNVFYYVEANFTMPAPPSNPKRPVYLYVVDPVTGATKKRTLGGVYNFPSGFQYVPEQDTIYIATNTYDGAEVNGSAFYKVDPETYDATLFSRSKATGDGEYAGWFHSILPNGTAALRLGFQNVVEESVPGVGVTDLTSDAATTTWVSLQASSGHDFYSTLFCQADGSFLSLATQTSSPNNFDLLSFGLDGSSKTLGTLGNAHPVPVFGYVASTGSRSQGILVTATVEAHFPAITSDRWVFDLYDMASGTISTLETVPALPAEEVALSGLGLPVST
eukprot:m.358738 g.358738  ORF g.358738 m.358738 type:complete len:465 (+) comp18265_c0_seq1:328-1722(+)